MESYAAYSFICALYKETHVVGPCAVKTDDQCFRRFSCPFEVTAYDFGADCLGKHRLSAVIKNTGLVDQPEIFMIWIGIHRKRSFQDHSVFMGLSFFSELQAFPSHLVSLYPPE